MGFKVWFSMSMRYTNHMLKGFKITQKKACKCLPIMKIARDYYLAFVFPLQQCEPKLFSLFERFV